MTTYTICHNDDDPKAPGHRRVVIDIRDAADFGDTDHDNRYVICADGVPTDTPLCANEEEADKTIRSYWNAKQWDLRME